MPEMPEVETLVRKINREINGSSIKDISIRWERSIAPTSYKKKTSIIQGANIVCVSRRGKFLKFTLITRNQKPLIMFVHLRMSGNLQILIPDSSPRKHDRVLFELEDGRLLAFHDPRKFGRIYLTEKEDEVISNLGIEPLSEEFTADALIDLLKERKSAIKPLLLSQRIVSGLGNIYVDEVLWHCKIHPQRKASSIPAKNVRALHKSIRQILQEAIDASGTDFGDNVVPDGTYQPRIYGRADQKCMRCKSKINRTKVGGRGTFYCPGCQEVLP